MKRLNCLYENKKDKKYPWLLKHPKIKDGLAKFQTRQQAIDWFLSLDMEVALWFQNDKKIFDGQLTSDFDENKFSYYIKTGGFDGGATYEQCCDEFFISPSEFTRNRYAEHDRIRSLDFVLLNDPKTYFPPELEISKKAKKEIVDVEAIKSAYQQQIDLLLTQMNDQSVEAQNAMDQLKEEIEKKDTNFVEMRKSMERLKNNIKVSEGIKYCRYIDLDSSEFLGALGLYIEKLNKLKPTIYAKKVSSKDFNLIKNNFQNVENEINGVESNENFEHLKTLKRLHKEFIIVKDEIISLLNEDASVQDLPIYRAYSKDSKTNTYTPLSWDTSYVIMNMKHIGFVPYEDYSYAISYLAQNVVNNFMILTEDNEPEENISSNTKEEIIEEVVVEETKPASSKGKEQMNETNNKVVEETTQKNIQEETVVEPEPVVTKPQPELQPETSQQTVINRQDQLLVPEPIVPVNEPNQFVPAPQTTNLPTMAMQSNLMPFNAMPPAVATMGMPVPVTPTVQASEEVTGPDKTNLYKILAIVFGVATLVFLVLIILSCLQIFGDITIFNF
ncbi:MAG3090 family protein [Mycoplasmopsis lipophila]|uniref:MAG3090 family protein n=1 Tax=Mycoplasmopsis lipophila TaxID=2117 RepID=UPI0038737566